MKRSDDFYQLTKNEIASYGDVHSIDCFHTFAVTNYVYYFLIFIYWLIFIFFC